MSARVSGRRLLMFVASSLLLAACGGGGGGGSASSGGGGGVVPSPTSTPTPATMTVTGTATDFNTGAPLSGFAVSVGAYPNASTCVAAETNTSNPCGTPVSPTTTTTAANGTFSVTVSPGSYMLVVAPVTTNAYATLHKGITASTAAVGTVKLTALSSDQQGWLADLNTQRAAAAYPASYANLTVDEYATEQATAYQVAGQAGPGLLTDAGWTPYFTAWSSAASLNGYTPAGVLATDVNPSPSSFTYGSVASGQYTNPVGAAGYVLADASWLWGDKSLCQPPTFSWQSCSLNHYVLASNTSDVWVGLGEAGPNPYYSNQENYGVLVVQI